MAAKKGWGGVRANSGRKKSPDTKKTVVIRVDEELIPIIKSLKEKYQAGQGIENLMPVKDNSKNLSSIPLNAIDLLHENKTLNKQNNELTIKANKELIKATSFESELKQYKKTNLDLVLQRDTEHSKAVKLESKANSLKSELKAKNTKIEQLNHREYDCQKLTKSGNRCTKPAKLKINWQDVEINVCLQHSKL